MEFADWQKWRATAPKILDDVHFVPIFAYGYAFIYLRYRSTLRHDGRNSKRDAATQRGSEYWYASQSTRVNARINAAKITLSYSPFATF